MKIEDVSKAKLRLQTASTRALFVRAEFDKINRFIDMMIIAELHWLGRFSDPRNNPFR